MEVQQDFKELIELFNAYRVQYVIVGDYALAFHGAPRYTGDIDILVRPDEDTAQRVLSALDEFILNKKAIGRKKDLADLEALGEN